MTSMSAKNIRHLDSLDDIREDYHRENPEPKMGAEGEYYIYKADADGTLSIATAAQTEAIIDHLRRNGHKNAIPEVVSSAEYGSSAENLDSTTDLLHNIKKDVTGFENVIREHGFTISNTSVLPFVTIAMAKPQVVNRPRAQYIVEALSRQNDIAGQKVALLTSASQVSISCRTADELLSTMRTAATFIPFIYGLSANHMPFMEGRPEPVNFNPRAMLYDQFRPGKRTFLNVLAAKDGEEFSHRHVDYIAHIPMLFFYDLKGNVIIPDKPIEFNQLPEKLQTHANIYLAKTFDYNPTKVVDVRNEKDEPTGIIRGEVRAHDGGDTKQILTAVAVDDALLCNPETVPEAQRALEDCGMSFDPDNPQEWIELNQQNLANAAYYRNRDESYLGARFGTATQREIGQALRPVFERYAEQHPLKAEAIAPAIEVCRTGVSVAEQRAREIPTYESCLETFRQYADLTKKKTTIYNKPFARAQHKRQS